MRIHLCKASEPFLDDLSCANKVKQYQERAVVAAQEIARLAKEHAVLGLFKVCGLSSTRGPLPVDLWLSDTPTDPCDPSHRPLCWRRETRAAP